MPHDIATRRSLRSTDPTLAVAERQLVLLGELAELAMAAARGFSASAVTAAVAEERILADEYFVPEIGRARACGAKEAAESFQKAARAARLSMKLEMTVAEIVRDIRAGRLTYVAGVAPRNDSRGGAGAVAALARACGVRETRDRDPRSRDSNDEDLVEFEREDTPASSPFGETVDALCADVGAEVDWTAWTVRPRGPAQAQAQKPSPLTDDSA